MPQIDRLLNAPDTIVADAQASLAHVHTATETGSVVASGGAASILALLNASAGAAQHTEHLLRRPTLHISLGDGTWRPFPWHFHPVGCGVCLQGLHLPPPSVLSVDGEFNVHLFHVASSP